MTEGLVFFALFMLAVVLMIVGVIGCAAHSRDEARQHDRSDPNRHLTRR